jgi:hypothetical protein
VLRLTWLGLVLSLSLLLLLALALYWVVPAYLMSSMDVSQRPTERSEPVTEAAPVTSYVSIPLALSVENIKRLVREQLSGKLLARNLKVPGRDLQVTIERNGTQALWIRDAEMHLVMPIKFETEGDLNTSGELTIFTHASFDVSEDWEPVVDARSTLRWDWQPRVGVWPFRFRIGKILSPYVQAALDKGADDFRMQAAGLYNLRTIAKGGWERLHGPHPLDNEGQTWLAMQPRELYMEPISSDESEVRLNLWMGGELGIAQGQTPATVVVTPLPKLRRDQPPSKTVALNAPVTVAYTRMLASLREALLGKPLPSALGTLNLTDLELYSSGSDVVLGLQFTGKKAGSVMPSRGFVYLTGQPHYDPETRTLSIRNLALTEAGNNPLAHGARWVLEDARNWGTEIARRMSWDIAPLLDEHQKQLGAYLNRTIDRRFDLWGDVTELVVTGVLPQPEGVLVRSQARGTLELLFVP